MRCFAVGAAFRLSFSELVARRRVVGRLPGVHASRAALFTDWHVLEKKNYCNIHENRYPHAVGRDSWIPVNFYRKFYNQIQMMKEVENSPETGRFQIPIAWGLIRRNDSYLICIIREHLGSSDSFSARRTFLRML